MSQVRFLAASAGDFSLPGTTLSADSYFSIHATPVLLQQNTEGPSHSAKSADKVYTHTQTRTNVQTRKTKTHAHTRTHTQQKEIRHKHTCSHTHTHTPGIRRRLSAGAEFMSKVSGVKVGVLGGPAGHLFPLQLSIARLKAWVR